MFDMKSKGTNVRSIFKYYLAFFILNARVDISIEIKSEKPQCIIKIHCGFSLLYFNKT